MGGEWSGGFSAGVATGAAMGRNQSEGSSQYVEILIPDLKAEQQLIETYADGMGAGAVRAALFEAIRKLDPNHPFSAPLVPGRSQPPAAAAIFDEVKNRIKATGLDDDPYLREICPGLTRNRDKAREEEAKAKAKAEAERIKAEAKAANPGFLKKLFG